MKAKVILTASMVVIVGLVAVAISSDYVKALVPGVNKMVSVNNTGNGQGGNDHSDDFNISANGKYVVFSSRASNLVSSDTNTYSDIFLRDLDTNTTTRVNTSASGVQSNNNSGYFIGGGQVISETGRYIAYTSQATNLIDGQTIPGTYPQVYMRDTLTNTVSIVTQKTDGTLGNAASANVQSISNDGRFVIWEGAKNTNLNPYGSTYASTKHFYLADLSNRTFALLSPQDGSGTVSNNGSAMSCDGSLAVVSTTAQLDAADTDTAYDIYLIDIRNGLTVKNLTSLSSMNAFGPSISCNGNYVTFTSQDTVYSSLIPSGNTNEHLYLYDRINDAISIVDTSTAGTLGNNYTFRPAGVDNQGNVVFSSNATNFGAYPAVGQFYLKNRTSGVLEVVSRTMFDPNTASNGAAGKASLSSDGKRVVYGTGPVANSVYAPTSTNWTSYDNNGKSDIVMSLTGL